MSDMDIPTCGESQGLERQPWQYFRVIRKNRQ